MKTMGGRQFWGDVQFYGGWRIQKNAITGHFRLLDETDFRHASGTREECVARLKAIRRENRLPPMQGHAVILVHGIIRSSKCFAQLQPLLEQQGFVVVPFDYPSTRIPITEAAGQLQEVVDSLEGITKISFVVHSMGGILVRTMLSEKKDPRFTSMVMLGVPNRGASLASQLKNNPLYRMVYGPAGQQLVDGEDGFIAKLPVPDFPFAIIAGAKGTPQGYNPLVDGDDDGTVALDSAKLPGAADFLTVPCLHSFLMGNKDVTAATVRFLRTGCLHENGECVPVPEEATEAAAAEQKPAAASPFGHSSVPPAAAAP